VRKRRVRAAHLCASDGRATVTARPREEATCTVRGSRAKSARGRGPGPGQPWVRVVGAQDRVRLGCEGPRPGARSAQGASGWGVRPGQHGAWPLRSPVRLGCEGLCPRSRWPRCVLAGSARRHFLPTGGVAVAHFCLNLPSL
jgi:hypothetical protein